MSRQVESQPESMSRRERKRHAKEELLLAAARELFANKGYDATTIDEIAERADFGKGSVYSYFRSKEEIFRTLIERAVAEVSTLFDRLEGEPLDAEAKLRFLVKELMAYYEQNFDFARLLATEIQLAYPDIFEAVGARIAPEHIELYHQHTAVIAKLIEQAQKEGVFSEIDASEAAAILRSIISAEIMSWGREGCVGSLAERSETVLNVFLNGLKIRTGGSSIPPNGC
jgi:AcrR family transcriptional regulator